MANDRSPELEAILAMAAVQAEQSKDIAELKQAVDRQGTAIAQLARNMEEGFKRIDRQFESLEREMNDRFEGVNQRLEDVTTELQAHGMRLDNLEAAAKV